MIRSEEEIERAFAVLASVVTDEALFDQIIESGDHDCVTGVVAALYWVLNPEDANGAIARSLKRVELRLDAVGVRLEKRG